MQISKNSEPGVRRSVTMPVRASESKTSRRSSVAPSPEPQIETLYKHPSVRIVSFTTTSVPTSRYQTSTVPGVDEEVGTLSWTSPLERLMAVGMNSCIALRRSIMLVSNLVFFRSTEHIQGSRFSCLPQLWEGYASNTSEIAMLVRRRLVLQVCPTDSKTSILEN